MAVKNHLHSSSDVPCGRIGHSDNVILFSRSRGGKRQHFGLQNLLEMSILFHDTVGWVPMDHWRYSGWKVM
jgi:hypothetical protein